MEKERKMFSKKKMKPKIINIEEPEDIEAGTARVMVSPVADDRSYEADVAPVNYGSVTREPPNVAPTAPPLSDAAEDAAKNRKLLFRKIFTALAAQQGIFAVLTVLFVYIPHLRKIFRTVIFDKLFLSSFIGFPLCIFFVFLYVLPKMRRLFAWPVVIILTACLSYLLSYVMTTGDAKAVMVSTLLSDTCSLTAVGTTFVSRTDLTSKMGLLYFPAFMGITSSVYPLASSYTGITYGQAAIPAVLTTLLMTHFGINARHLLRDPNLNLTPAEYPFAVVQLWLKLSEWEAIKNIFRNRVRPEGYTSI